MIEGILMTITGLCCIMTIVSIFMIHREGKVLNAPIKNLIIPKTKYVYMVIEWCHQNLRHKQTKKPKVKVKYHQNKTVNGTYNPKTHEVVILINTHTTLRELTNTIIHEYIHSRQKNRSFYKMYETYNQTVGYHDNPYEIESRMISKKKERECVMELVSSNRILQ